MQEPTTGVTAKSPTRRSDDVLCGEPPLYGFTAPQDWHKPGDWDRPHWVYVIATTGVDGPVKIGITNSLRERVWALSAGHPEGVEVLASYAVNHWLARQIERRIHSALAEEALGREWFDVCLADVRPMLTDLVEWAHRAKPILRDASAKLLG